MTIQPWYVGQTSPAWTLTLSVPGDVMAPNLTGLTTSALTLVVVDKLTGTVTNGLGTFTSISNAQNPATVVYQPNANDLFVLNNKSYRLYIKVQFSNGPDIFGPYAFTTTAL